MERQEQYLQFFSPRIREILQKSGVRQEELQEIRMRAERPLLLLYKGKEYAVTKEGELTGEPCRGYRVSREDLRGTLECVSGYSLYAFDEEMKQGFITVSGGHRVGLAGKIIMEDGKIRCIRHISFLNIRLSHQIKGCADPVLPWVIDKGEVCHTLLISPPRCGKTTLLRDLIRQISDGSSYAAGKTVGVVDERSELGGSYLGIPQNDLGMRTDILDCCTKAEGMMMLLRSMAPQVIAVDEIGNERDSQAIESVIHCGCRLLATAHGNSLEDIRRRPLLARLLDQRIFERYIVLGNGSRPGEVRSVCDRYGKEMQGGGQRDGTDNSTHSGSRPGLCGMLSAREHDGGQTEAAVGNSAGILRTSALYGAGDGVSSHASE